MIVTISLDDNSLMQLEIVIQACYNIGASIVSSPDGEKVPLAEIAVDLKRELKKQIDPQLKQ